MAGRLRTKVRLSRDAGRAAYEAHIRRNTQAKSWDKLTSAVQQHWEHVAQAVLNEVKGDAE